MPDTADPASRARPRRAVATAAFLVALSAILVGFFSLMLPTSSKWEEPRIWLFFFVTLAVATVLAWSIRHPEESAAVTDGLALALGGASTIVGVGALILVGYGLVSNFADSG